MTELVVIGYEDQHRAAQVLNEIGRLEEDWTVDLNDAVVVVRDKNGRLRVQQSYQLTSGEGAAMGAFWGGLLGALFAIPFTGGLSAPAIAALLAAGGLSGSALGALGGSLDARTWRDDFGISEDFIGEVGRTIRPGNSALFVLLRTANPQKAVDAISPFGGKVLRTSLTPEQQRKLEALLSQSKARKAA